VQNSDAVSPTARPARLDPVVGLLPLACLACYTCCLPQLNARVSAGCACVCRMLEGLHSAGHCIGPLLLESVLIQPELVCLECAAGCNWLSPAPVYCPCLCDHPILALLNLNTYLGCHATHVGLSVMRMKPSLSSALPCRDLQSVSVMQCN